MKKPHQIAPDRAVQRVRRRGEEKGGKNGGEVRLGSYELVQRLHVAPGDPPIADSGWR
jgi:hypothetical protein